MPGGHARNAAGSCIARGLGTSHRVRIGRPQYQTLTKNGLTIMFAHMPTHVRTYAIVQVGVSNGSTEPIVVKPEDFRFEFADGKVTAAMPAIKVINELVRTASGDDVIKLVMAYEMSLYGMDRFRSTNGYEKRRQNALVVVSSTKLKSCGCRFGDRVGGDETRARRIYRRGGVLHISRPAGGRVEASSHDRGPRVRISSYDARLGAKIIYSLLTWVRNPRLPQHRYAVPLLASAHRASSARPLAGGWFRQDLGKT